MARSNTNPLASQHPLQRLSSPSRGLSALLHSAGLLSFTLSFIWLQTHPNPINSAYGWHFQYLTIIGLLLSTLTFLMGLISDFSLSSSLFTIKNTLSVCSAPLAVLISVLYWTLRAVDPTLVVPPEFELPVLPDLGFHASPALFLLLDLLFFSPPWGISRGGGFALSVGIACAYWVWIERCYERNGFYPYPLFELLGTAERVGVFGGSAVLMAGVSVLITWMYGVVNGVDGQKRKTV